MHFSLRCCNTGSRYYDIIITGGGMVGSMMACCLTAASSNLSSKSVLLLEAEKPKTKLPPSDPYIYSNRVSAINPASRRLFENIGLWKKLTEHNKYKVVKQLRVWDACSTSSINFEHSNFEKDVAYIIENANIIDAASKHLQEYQSNKFLVKNETKITKLTLPQNLQEMVQVQLSDGSTCTTSLLIGADGLNSTVRSVMNSYYVSWLYGQKGIVATLDIQTVGDNSVAWQRFTPTGPVALLPLTETKSSLVWTTTDEEAARLLTLPPDQFVDSLNKVLWEDVHQSPVVNSVLSAVDNLMSYVGAGTNVSNQLPPTIINVDPSSRAAFPLGFGHASRYIHNRAVLIGDAAHRVHPLAGHGVNLGFADCTTLTQILQTSVNEGADIGAIPHLKEYETKRQLKNLPVMLTIDFLNRLYGTDFLPFVLTRSIGLNATNRLPFLKDIIIGQASTHV